LEIRFTKVDVAPPKALFLNFLPHMISAVIITFNEEKNIGRCLDSLRGLADEIVVVDSYSTDRTEQICRERQVNFMRHVFEGHIQQKNFAVEQATFDYVLSLDADECISEELRQSILQAKKNLTYDAYSVNRLNHLCGKVIRHGGWYPDRKIRLWNRTKGRWGGINPHDKVEMTEASTLGFLKGDLLHFTADTFEAFARQQEKFAAIAAKEMRRLGKTSPFLMNVVRAGWMFFRRYFLQLGFLDGYHGWFIARESARYTFTKYQPNT
jgi:glycosyltransferase involved in cell wall biosynthesis